MFEEKDGYKTLTVFSLEAESASIANKHRTGFTFPELKSVLYSAKVSLAVLVYKKYSKKEYGHESERDICFKKSN